MRDWEITIVVVVCILVIIFLAWLMWKMTWRYRIPQPSTFVMMN